MSEEETSFTWEEKGFIAKCVAGGVGVGALAGAGGLGLVLGGIGLVATGPVAGGIFAGA